MRNNRIRVSGKALQNLRELNTYVAENGRQPHSWSCTRTDSERKLSVRLTNYFRSVGRAMEIRQFILDTIKSCPLCEDLFNPFKSCKCGFEISSFEISYPKGSPVLKVNGINAKERGAKMIEKVIVTVDTCLDDFKQRLTNARSRYLKAILTDDADDRNAIETYQKEVDLAYRELTDSLEKLKRGAFP